MLYLETCIVISVLDLWSFTKAEYSFMTDYMQNLAN